MRRLIPRRQLLWWQGVLIALAATVVAWVIRMAVQGVLKDQTPYATFIIGAVFTTIFGGWRSGAIAALLGGLLGNWSFVPPFGALSLSGRYGLGLAVYFLVASVFIWIMESFTTSHRKALALNDQLVILGHEYRHRIKNLLAMAQSIVQQTGRYTTDMPEFQDKVVGRLQALARAQDILSESNETGAELRELIERTLRPFDVEQRLTWPMSGPRVVLPPDAAVALALLLNELATNATKYGALSVPEGRLKLGWAVENGWVTIEWCELDGPPVTPPTRRGFGSRLFEQSMPRASGRATLTFEPEGVSCEIKLAVSNDGGDGGEPKTV